jgi:hypothetical protein
VKYQHPIPNSLKDIAQVKVFSLRCDADAELSGQSSRRAKNKYSEETQASLKLRPAVTMPTDLARSYTDMHLISNHFLLGFFFVFVCFFF